MVFGKSIYAIIVVMVGRFYFLFGIIYNFVVRFILVWNPFRNILSFKSLYSKLKNSYQEPVSRISTVCLFKPQGSSVPWVQPAKVTSCSSISEDGIRKDLKATDNIQTHLTSKDYII